MTPTQRPLIALALSLLLACTATQALAQRKADAAASAARQPAVPARADYIVAVVNNELVTQFEVDQRVARAREDAARSGAKLPGDAELRRQALDALINERVLITYARDSGVKVDDQELDRAVANIAAMNKLSLTELRARLREEGLDYTRFRANLRDQILAERVREREVQGRIKVSDTEITDYIEALRARQGVGQPGLNIAQIMVVVPEGASEAVVAERRARAQAALARVQAGEPFDKVAREVSEDGNHERGGEIGAKPADRLPDLFVDAVKNLPVGGVTPQLVRSGAGFHILKLLDRSQPGLTATQTHARHILLRTSARVGPEALAKRLAELREQIVSGKRRFEDVAREVSEDGSAPAGGDLGWVSPGAFVPEFEQAMDRLPLDGISEPVESRFGMHLIQVLERRTVPVDMRQLREQARNALREQKYEAAYNEWADELRSRAYIEMREPPQ